MMSDQKGAVFLENRTFSFATSLLDLITFRGRLIEGV
jgi:hypothetical protein